MKKIIILIALISLIPLSAMSETQPVAEQSHQELREYKRPLMMTLTAGANFNTGGKELPELFGYRQDVASQIDWRFSMSFSRHWSAYLGVGVAFYEFKAMHSNGFFDFFFPVMNKIHPTFELGVNFMTAINRWQFIPRLGIGQSSINDVKESWTSTPRNNGVDEASSSAIEHWSLKRKIEPWYVAFGTSIGFRTSNICSVILDIQYHCPITRSKTTLSIETEDNSRQKRVEKFATRSFGDEFSVSLGMLFQLELSK